MAKIGRNQPCPCGSGKKYKHCCLTAQQEKARVDNQAKITLMDSIERIQLSAQKKEAAFFELGVFVFFSNSSGDAWLFEMTEQDAVQVAQDGSVMEVPVEENEETIEMNWSHTFTIREKQLFITEYSSKEEARLENAPVQQIHAAVKRIRKRFSPELLDQVHVPSSNTGR